MEGSKDPPQTGHRASRPLQHALAHDLPPRFPSAASVLARSPSFAQFASPGSARDPRVIRGDSPRIYSQQTLLAKLTTFASSDSSQKHQNSHRKYYSFFYAEAAFFRAVIGSGAPKERRRRRAVEQPRRATSDIDAVSVTSSAAQIIQKFRRRCE
jgi:hypothetical protein